MNHDEPETFDHFNMNKNGQGIPRTSHGRKIDIVAYRPPKKGEIYLLPSGKRGIFFVKIAQNDHTKHIRLILRP